MNIFSNLISIKKYVMGLLIRITSARQFKEYPQHAYVFVEKYGKLSLAIGYHQIPTLTCFTEICYTQISNKDTRTFVILDSVMKKISWQKYSIIYRLRIVIHYWWLLLTRVNFGNSVFSMEEIFLAKTLMYLSFLMFLTDKMAVKNS